MSIVTTDPTQQKIHASSHGGMNVVNELLLRLRGRGAVVGKEYAGLKAVNCSTDVYVEDDRSLRTVEVKYSASSPLCPQCKKIMVDHMADGCRFAGSFRPSHKNCGNRFRDAIGSICMQWNSDLVRSLKKEFVPHFLIVDLSDPGGPNEHENLMEYVRRAKGKVELVTSVPGPAEFDRLASWVWGP